MNDSMLKESLEKILFHNKASAASLQRSLKIGYAVAAHRLDAIEELGFIGPFRGTKPRVVYKEKIEEYLK